METGCGYPLSHSSLWRILNVCSASTHTSLQGLNLFSAEGAKAFDDLVAVVDKLGDVYELGLTWPKDKTEKLKLAKRFVSSLILTRNCKKYRLPLSMGTSECLISDMFMCA